jgi:hypothetical protein
VGQTASSRINADHPKALAALRKLRSLTVDDRRLFLSAFVAVASVRAALLLARLSTVHRLLVSGRGSHKRCPAPLAGERARRLAWAVTAAGARIPGATCLPRAVALQWLLVRQGERSRVHVGFTRHESGEVRGHAWLEHRGEVLLGGGNLSRFSRLMTLDAKPSTGRGAEAGGA